MKKSYAILLIYGVLTLVACGKHETAEQPEISKNINVVAQVLDERENKKSDFSDIKVEEPEKEVIEVPHSKFSKGDIVFFGTYEQDNLDFTSDEQIEWIVLDSEGTKLLLLSKYILDAGSYNIGNSVDYRTWDNSPVREWLNSSFYDIAFSREEKNAILLTHNVTSPNPDWGSEGGEDTDDNVFLLSIDEANKYFPNNDLSIITTATAYAYAQNCDMYDGSKTYYNWGIYPDPYPGINGTVAYWWLRSPGYTGKNSLGQFEIRAAFVKADSYPITNRGEFQSQKLGLRPALWIDTAIYGDDNLDNKKLTEQD